MAQRHGGAGAEDYVYSTADIARYYGLTSKGLAFYEKKGIIEPVRTRKNNYRVFTLSDCYNMYLSKLYANCGYSLAETAASLKGGDARAQAEDFAGHLASARRELALREMLLSREGGARRRWDEAWLPVEEESSLNP